MKMQFQATHVNCEALHVPRTIFQAEALGVEHLAFRGDAGVMTDIEVMLVLESLGLERVMTCISNEIKDSRKEKKT